MLRQDKLGRELLGSIHSHPDWQHIGPEHERRMHLSESPTPMDEYLFYQTVVGTLPPDWLDGTNLPWRERQIHS